MSGLIVKLEDLKGLIVNEFQAIELSKLIGLEIK